MTLPIACSADREHAQRDMKRRFPLKAGDIKPAVYFRLTDHWLELTLRFVVEDHGVRAVKDAMSRGAEG